MKAQFTYRSIMTAFEVDEPPPHRFNFKMPKHPKEKLPAMTLHLELEEVRKGVAVYRVASVKAAKVGSVVYPE